MTHHFPKLKYERSADGEVVSLETDRVRAAFRRNEIGWLTGGIGEPYYKKIVYHTMHMDSAGQMVTKTYKADTDMDAMLVDATWLVACRHFELEQAKRKRRSKKEATA